MIYAKWSVFALLVVLAQILGLVAVPICNRWGWPQWAWGIWGNDDGEIVGHADDRDTDRSFRWLALTNRAHNFALKLGVVVQDYTHEGDEKVSDQGYPGRWVLWQDNAFEYYKVVRILKFLPWPLCFRLRLGWKLHGMQGQIAPLVLHVSIRKYAYKPYEA